MRLRLQQSGARHFQLTFGVSFSSCSQGEWAGELPLERQRALPSEFSFNAHPNSDFQLLAHIFFVVKRSSVIVKAVRGGGAGPEQSAAGWLCQGCCASELVSNWRAETEISVLSPELGFIMAVLRYKPA